MRSINLSNTLQKRNRISIRMKELFSGYILAGGKSSRMGRDKAFLEINGKSFLENAADALRPYCSSVKIVLNKSQTHFIEKIPVVRSHIFDNIENRGAPGGIHAALEDCRTEFAIILAVDLPLLSKSVIKNLTEKALSHDEFAVVVPRQSDGKRQPLCAVYRVNKCLPELVRLLDEQASPSVRDFLGRIPAIYIEAGELGGENFLFNVNQPSDYELIKKIESP